MMVEVVDEKMVEKGNALREGVKQQYWHTLMSFPEFPLKWLR